MEFPSDEEIEGAIKHINIDIFLFNVFDTHGENQWLREAADFLQDCFYKNGNKYSVFNVYNAFCIWINTGLNLINVLSTLYPLEEDIKYRDNFNVCDLPCILNGITPQIGANARNWMYRKPRVTNYISLITDAIFANKIIPIHPNRQLAMFNLDFHLDARLLPVVSVIEWIDNEVKRDPSFPIRLPQFIVDYKKSLPEYSRYKEKNERLCKDVEEYKRNIEKYEQEIRDLKEILVSLQDEQDANSKNLSSWSLLMQSLITKFIPNFDKNNFLFTEDAFFKKEFIVNSRKCSIKQILIEITKEQAGKDINDETIKDILETIRKKAHTRQRMKS